MLLRSLILGNIKKLDKGLNMEHCLEYYLKPQNLFQEMLLKVPLIATRWLEAKMKQQTLEASLLTLNGKIYHPVYQQCSCQPEKGKNAFES